MVIPPEQLDKFIELYFKEYGIVLTEEKAIAELTKLLQLYQTIYLKKA